MRCGSRLSVVLLVGLLAGCGEEPRACYEVGDAASCRAQTDCTWDESLYRVRTDAGVCSAEPAGRCRDLSGGTAGGCAGQSCGATLVAGEIWWDREADGVTVLLNRCGAQPPEGMEMCSLGPKPNGDPPECACGCTLFGSEP